MVDPVAAFRKYVSTYSWKKTKAFLLKNHLPIGLAIGVLFGYLVPWPGIQVGKSPWNTISIAGIFFITGIGLQTEEIKKALKAYVAIIYGILSILVFSPLFSLAIAKINVEPREFPLGLAIFMAMPTTVSSGAIMTGEAKGNVALSILFSVVTNMLGVLTVPFFLSAFMSSGSSGGGSVIDPLDLLWKLTLSILVPLLIGKALRYFNAVVEFSKKYKLQLKLFCSFLLITVPWIYMSQSAAQLNTMSAGSVFLLLVLSIVFHGGLLVANYAACRALPMTLAERKAVVINASQKTVNTAMSVLQFLPPGVADVGLLSLPCIINHFVQIIMDAYVVSAWAKYVDPPAAMSSSATAAVAGTTATAAGSASVGATADALPPTTAATASTEEAASVMAADGSSAGAAAAHKHAGYGAVSTLDVSSAKRIDTRSLLSSEAFASSDMSLLGPPTLTASTGATFSVGGAEAHMNGSGNGIAVPSASVAASDGSASHHNGSAGRSARSTSSATPGERRGTTNTGVVVAAAAPSQRHLLSSDMDDASSRDLMGAGGFMKG